jgi:hypothetical protein
VIGKMTEQPSANRPDDEAECEQNRGVQLLNDRIAAWKERACEIKGKGRVRIKVVPLDEIANRADENRPYPSADICEIERFVSGVNLNRYGP